MAGGSGLGQGADAGDDALGSLNGTSRPSSASNRPGGFTIFLPGRGPQHCLPGYGEAVNVDPRAASGFAAVADSYQRGRPTYPTKIIDRIMTSLDLTDTSSVLDLAAGTGQLSRLFHRRVRRIVAVEPVATMRAKIAVVTTHPSPRTITQASSTPSTR